MAPKWRRAEGQRLGSYDLKANTAQIDEKAAKLVCAAALAAGGDRPLLLILGELLRDWLSSFRPDTSRKEDSQDTLTG